MSSAWLSDIQLGVLALRRDWRSGELRLIVLALVIAVAAVTSVGFLADRVGRALERNSAEMLGGDIALVADEPIPASFVERARAVGLDVTQSLEFPSMVSSASGAQLASLKAVEPGYPLRGALEVHDAATGKGVATRALPDPGTVWVDSQILSLLGLESGDMITVGDTRMKIARIIAYEPDRGLQLFNVAPRVMLRAADLPGTGLVAPGSRIRYKLLAAGAPAAVESYKHWLAGRLERGQRLSTLESTRPEIQHAFDRAGKFLMLVALLAVMIAAVAVALASRRFSQRHQDGIAIMRCLGAASSQLGRMLWVEFLLLGAIASLAGTCAGYLAHLGLGSVVATLTDTVLPAPTWQPLLQGLATGLLLLTGFALPPLAALRKIAPARVLRHETNEMWRERWPATSLGVLAFFLLVWWISRDARLSLVVSAGFLAALGLFAVLAYAAVRVVGLLRSRAYGRPDLHFALAGIAQRRGLTVAQVCALSIGLMALLLLAITRTDLLAGWQRTLPADTPNTFLINIQPDQRSAVQARLRDAGMAPTTLYPMVRGRLLTINQRPVSGDSYPDDRAKRLVEREFNLSYVEQLPQSNVIERGRWLDLGRDEVSIESGLAETLGIRLGDRLEFDVAGRTVAAEVTSLRNVKWDSFQANFFAILTPRALAGDPATFITSFHVGAGQPALKQELVHEFPNLTVFDVGSILDQIQRVLDQVIQAVQWLFLFTIAAGILVLGAAFFSTRDERMHEVAILRTLGASARQLSAALRIELFLVGTLAGLLAAAGAVSIAAILAERVFDFALPLSWWPWLAGVAAGVVSAGVGGGLTLRGVLDTPPLVSLRATS